MAVEELREGALLSTEREPVADNGATGHWRKNSGDRRPHASPFSLCASLFSTSLPLHPSLWRCGPEMQWFSSGSGPSSTAAPSSSQPSLLAEWNSYAAARSADDAGDGFGIDIEAAVRSANDRVAGTFGVCVNPTPFIPPICSILLGACAIGSYQ
ncbi:hypothetical protein HU200_058807 [Digitaria exilis]|uniref:Vesicle transport protein n=1 Tax=Digitaria exilis TaxID=1010633 RepID=A0A835ACW2_9POAL|nr:hypothetical protein HU200_058807 [Digitaria exilis]